MAKTSAGKKVAAAGTVVLRPVADGEPEVLLVHRPRYNDWSLPKGKIDPDEYLAGCAVRETLEETAVDVRLGMPLDQITYPVERRHEDRLLLAGAGRPRGHPQARRRGRRGRCGCRRPRPSSR